MKHLIIKVVSFFAWMGLVFSTVGGGIVGSQAGHQLVGAILGFLIGCLGSGIWFLLVSMHDKLTTIAMAANRISPSEAQPSSLALEEKSQGWLDVISGHKP